MTTRVVVGPVELEFLTDKVVRLFHRAPAITFTHVRDYVGAAFGSHRREWQARRQAKFHPGGLKVTTGAGGRRGFFYRVEPAGKTPAEGSAPDLEAIRGEAFTSSQIAKGLETGGTFTARSGRYLALPIGVTLDAAGRRRGLWRTPAAFRAASAGNDLVSFRSRRGGPIILWQVRRGVRAARTAGAVGRVGETGKKRNVYLPAYLLVPRVTRKARLRFYATWNELAGDRSQRLTRAVDRIVEAL